MASKTQVVAADVEQEIVESSSEEEMVDLECGGVPEAAEMKKVHVAGMKRDCRICHLSMDATNHENGIPMELGCSCKDDLAAAHNQCAETWFKIKGNKTCEICCATAHNVAGVNETQDAAVPSAPFAMSRLADNQTYGRVIGSSTSCWLVWSSPLSSLGSSTSMCPHNSNFSAAGVSFFSVNIRCI